MTETLKLRLHSPASSPTLLYLPGLHGDWTLLGPFRHTLAGRARLAEVTYPRRPDWRLDDYAHGVEQAARAHGLDGVWLLAESFSSQVGWAMVGRVLDGTSTLRIQGLILAGGFVRHPWPWGVGLVHHCSRLVPHSVMKKLCALYARSACRRCGASGEIAAELAEFADRRAAPGDRATLNSRYRILTETDIRPIARRARLPVFQLSGTIDPLVPWWSVRRWLARECPGYRASRILSGSGHNHLLDAPAASAEQILAWTKS